MTALNRAYNDYESDGGLPSLKFLPGGKAEHELILDSEKYVSKQTLEPINEFLEKINNLNSLPENWDGQSALEIDKNVLINATRYYVRLVSNVVGINDLGCPSVIPSTDGGVQLEWHIDENDIEIEICPTGPMFLFVDGPCFATEHNDVIERSVLYQALSSLVKENRPVLN